MKKILLLALPALLLFSCKNNEETDPTMDNNTSMVPPPLSIEYDIVNIYPHDTTFFTQGLFFHEGQLYESTGNTGTSWMLKTDYKTGKSEKLASLPAPLFGEGSVALGGKIYQLTWTHKKVMVYDAKTMKQIKELSWPFEGWGLTTDGRELIVSTGTSELYFVDPETFKINRQLTVNNNYGPVASLNELEYVDGFIYANVFLSNDIVKIDPSNGYVTGKLNMVGLLTADPKPLNGTEASIDNVLNGIAYNPATKTFFVTGKRWSKMFEIRLL